LETIVKKLYEAMFLVDSAVAAADWEGVDKAIKTVLKRAEAEIVSIRKWEDRRLAYEIGGKARGMYVLCYFRAAGERIRDIERDVRLSERIMRVLILCAEHMTEEDLEKDTPAIRAEKYREKVAEATAQKSAVKAGQSGQQEQLAEPEAEIKVEQQGENKEEVEQQGENKEEVEQQQEESDTEESKQ
jgi:small subunit ribosomal protein S6